jgi:hypothetical protein
MDTLFARLIDKHTPKVNPMVMDGIACTYMKSIEQYIDRVFRSASKSFPSSFKYLGYQRCTPVEEFEETSKIRNNKRVFDMAKSDLYLIKCFFSFMDEPLPPKYIYLPFVRDAATLYLGGSLYHVTPVLSDKVISPGFDSVFIRLLRDKMMFKRCYHTIVVNGERETITVVWSQIHRKTTNNTKAGITTKANTTIVHYLFAKYGFKETFIKYCGFEPIVGNSDTINSENYPSDKWIICESSCVKPKTYIFKTYEPNLLRVAIPIEHWNNMSKSLMSGFWYTVDHFPNRFRVGYENNTDLWMILLGHIVFSGAYGENKLYASISDHFMSLDDYVDTIIIERLAEAGYVIDNFYDLLALLTDKFNDFILDNDNTALSMYGKSLEVLYYMMYDITSGIFNVNFRLSKLASKKELTKNDIIGVLNKNLRPRAIMNLVAGTIILESVSYSGDHKYPKMTSRIQEQESMPRSTRSKNKKSTLGQDKYFEISMSEAGSMLFLSKSNPTPTNRLNCFCMIDAATATIIPNPKFEELRKKTDALLRGMSTVV